MNTPLKRAVAIAAGAVTALGLVGAVAQPRSESPEAPSPERLKAFLEERAKTRPRFSPPPLGLLPQGIARAEMAWAEAARLVRETQLRDAQSTAFTQSQTNEGSIGLRRAPIEALPRVRLPEISRVSMPVLVPATPEILATVVVYGQPDAYTGTAEAADGVSFRISGSRKKLVLPERGAVRDRVQRFQRNGLPLPSLDTTYNITRSHSSTDLSFSKFGAGYVMSLICDDPENDPRCTEDDFIQSLASSMALLNENSEADREEGEQ